MSETQLETEQGAEWQQIGGAKGQGVLQCGCDATQGGDELVTDKRQQGQGH